MPPRISRSSVSGGISRPQQNGNKRRKQRSLNAYSIASEQNQEKSHTRRRRLGEIEEEGPRRKRQRLQDDNDDPDDSNTRKIHRSRTGQDLGGNPEVSEGSDSEGREWRMGDVRDADDSDVDSDEAFGESDEERFEAFTFGASKSKSKRPLKTKPHEAVGAEEGVDLVENEDGTGEEHEDFGEEGVDLAQLLDDDDGEETQSSGSVASGSDERDEEDTKYSENDSDSNDDAAGKTQYLRDMIASIPKADGHDPGSEEESAAPNAQELLKSLQTMQNLDPSLSQSVKTLSRDTAKSKDNQPTTKVKVPLPKRQQDKIDRAAAYEKAKETLNRWVDTVKHNRRAEHLIFPLSDPMAQEARGESRMAPTVGAKPRNDLENAIKDILQSSGFADTGPRSEENKLKDAEDIEANSLPLEEVMAKRAELRKQRDLLFREEKRAKRIKKIKSKAYRRVHRKDKEREAQKERDLMAAAGIEIPEEQQEAIDRRRAEERMGARHKESRWAKGVKQSGRGAWDEDARSGVAEMARRSEQLKQRLAGNNLRNTGDSDNDNSSEDSSGGEDEGGFSLRESLGQLQEDQDTTNSTSRLSSLKFMQRADAVRKQQNEEATKQILRDLKGDASESEDEGDARPGRQIFGAARQQTPKDTKSKPKLDFEEPEGSDSEADSGTALKESLGGAEVDLDNETKNPSVKGGGLQMSKGESGTRRSKNQLNFPATSADGTKKRDLHTQNSSTRNSVTMAASGQRQPVSKKAVSQVYEDGAEGEEDSTSPALLPSNLELVQAAFGGDEVEAEFAKEKQDLVEDEDDKVIDNILPGWGSWTGSGLSKQDKRTNAQKKASGRFSTKQAGVKAVDRKDAKLGNRVIISEKHIKKNQKYLAPVLPHPFESRQQYERSLRIPIGPEWTTKESFQSATKPRVMLKRGIIKPIEAPLL